MTEFLTVSWYVVPAVVMAIASAIIFLGGIGVYYSLPAWDTANKKETAGVVLIAFGMLVFGAWIWPLVVPVVICFILFKMVGEFISFPKKEN